MLAAALLGALIALVGWPAAAQTPELQLPVACTPGVDCWVQNYPDDDTLTGSAHDYTCGGATYDGHDGTDIRVLSVDKAAGVAVLAAAAGTVRAIRDGEPDHLMRTAADRAAVAGRECGNGLAITHADGWETQYCHLRKGSIRVRQGDKVQAGTVLGEIGQSGETEFPHLHLTLRQGKVAIDPFSRMPVKNADKPYACGSGSGQGHWSEAVAKLLGQPATAVLEVGFASVAPQDDTLEVGHAEVPPPHVSAPALVFFARIMHLRAGDRVHIRIDVPSGPPLDQTSEPLSRDSAVRVLSGVRTRTAATWIAGDYAGQVEVLRNGAVVASGKGGAQLR